MRTNTAVDIYRRKRAKWPTVPASHAWQWAQTEAERIAAPPFEWTESNDGYTAEIERDGYTVTIAAKYDYDSEPNVTFQSDWADGAVQHPNWDDFMAATEGRGDDYNLGYRTPDVYRYIVPNYATLEDDRAALSAAGYSRGDADLKARQGHRKAAHDSIREDRAVFWFNVTAYRAGVELGSDSLGGYDVDPDGGYAEMLLDLMGGVLDHEMIDNALAEAKEKLAELSATADTSRVSA